MDAKDIPAGTIKPGEDDHPIPGSQVLEAVEDVRLEDEPSLGAPSSPCLGADATSSKGDSTVPIAMSWKPDWSNRRRA